MKTHAERIAIAESLLSYPATIPSGDPRSTQAIGGAQAQALLAIAEQLRIANLIAVATFNRDVNIENEQRGIWVTPASQQHLSQILEQIRVAMDLPKDGDPE